MFYGIVPVTKAKTLRHGRTKIKMEIYIGKTLLNETNGLGHLSI